MEITVKSCISILLLVIIKFDCTLVTFFLEK